MCTKIEWKIYEIRTKAIFKDKKIYFFVHESGLCY